MQARPASKRSLVSLLGWLRRWLGDVFYVYQLIDPRNSLPFYVGKGKGLRAWSHSKAVRAGKSSGNLKKDQLISELFAAGLDPIVRIVAEYEDQADAFDHEIEMISTISGLLNILKGGQGWALSPEEAQRRAAARTVRLADEKMAKDKAYLANWLCMAEKWPNGCTVPGLENGDALGDEFMRNVKELVELHGSPAEVCCA